MSQKAKVGIISAAWGVQAHLPAWRSLEDVEVPAICTSRQATADSAAATHGFQRAYGDFREMVRAADLDIIDVGTRPRLRLEMVTAAVEQGKHVYVGIPFAMNAAEAEQMVKMQEEAGVTGAVDAFIQATPAAQRMKELIEEGYLGKLSGVHCTFHLQLFTEAAVNVPGYEWFSDASQGASVLRNLGSHAFHAIVSMFGPVREVVGSGTRHLDRWVMPDGATEFYPGVDDNAVALFRLDGGVIGQLSLCWNASDGTGFTLEAWGSKGRLILRSPGFPQSYDTRLAGGEVGGLFDFKEAPLEIPERLRRVDGSHLRGEDEVMAVFPMAKIFRDIVDAVANGGQPEPSFRQALHVQKVIDAVERSYQTRSWETVDGAQEG
jgi:predicted dehydrogenase